MYLCNLRLYNFRNFTELDINFKKGINIFYGDNAQGKTNLLEAIFFTAMLKSPRAYRERELILSDKNLAFLKAKFNTNSGEVVRQVKIYKDRKKEVIEGESVKTRWSQLDPAVKAVYFSPDDIDIIKGDPAGRRKFLDGLLYFTKPGVYKYLKGYQRVLTQRNKLLKAVRSKPGMTKALDVWDEQLLELGSQLIVERLLLLKKVSGLLEKYFNRFTGSRERLKIRYSSSVSTDDINRIKIDFKERLAKCREKDINLSYTSVGPHRDDIDFFIDGKNVKRYASQGQQRLLVLCMKFAQRNLLYNETGEYPILLLDDVMSELDAHHRQLILGCENQQVFITTTDLKFIPEDIISRSYLYQIRAGALE